MNVLELVITLAFAHTHTKKINISHIYRISHKFININQTNEQTFVEHENNLIINNKASTKQKNKKNKKKTTVITTIAMKWKNNV